MRKLVFMREPPSYQHWLKHAWFQGYPVEYFNPKRKYTTDVAFYYDMYGPWHDRMLEQLERGHKIIYDANNEHYLHGHDRSLIDTFCKYPGQVLVLVSGVKARQIPGLKISALPYWYWIIDQTEFFHCNYHMYNPQPRHEHKFFMQLNRRKDDRDYLYQQIQPVLHQALHSYRAYGICLPKDSSNDNWQRHMNWDWVDSCSITLAVESYLDDQDLQGGFSLTENDNQFLSEKTYKPLAYGHAFLLASTQGNLAHVRDQGFETFPELWDESYDLLPNYQDRVQAIVKIIKEFDPGSLINPITQEKIAHNRNRFFDREITARLIRQTIIDPVLAFLYE